MVRKIEVATLKDLESQDFHDFSANILGKRTFVVFVMADWCGHCKQLKPVLKRAIAEVNKGKTATKNNKPASTGSARTMRLGGNNNKELTLLQLSDETAAHIMKHEDNQLANALKTHLKGYPTGLAITSVTRANTQGVLEFQANRTVGDVKAFLETAENL